MISKNDFLEFVSRVERTEKGIAKLENALGGISLREQDFCAFSNQAANFAFLLLGHEEEDSYFENFLDDFWEMIDFSKIKRKENQIVTWEQFYDYWKKEK